jgi:hypothetical protein
MRIFVIALENQSASDVYGSSSAPYLNTVLAPIAARSTRYGDVLPLAIESGPHYVWLEAGTNVFPDHSFVADSDPSASASTSSTEHLVTQIDHAGKSWLIYMQGIDGNTGACPLISSGAFAAWHDPVTWFRDVSGNPPSTDNASCAAHHRDFSAFAPELAAGTVADFNFIVPDLCHDMHGLPSCADGDAVHAGDSWLAANLPPLIDDVKQKGGVIYVLWDETSATNPYGDPLQPFYAVGPGVKPGYVSNVPLDHSAYLRTVEEQLGLPILPSVQNAPDLADLFTAPIPRR